MSGYTKGPWEFHEDDGEDNQIVVGDNGDVICVVGSYMTSVEEDFANGPLIAAAPELLEALQKIVEMNAQYCHDKYGDSSKAESMACVRVARAAIAKALGNN